MFVLGHKLMRLAESTFPSSEVRTGDRIIFFDAGTHPGSAITEIAGRTGLPQSHVSTTVAKFRERGVLTTEQDPHDRRRTLVHLTAGLVTRAVTVASAAEGVLATSLGADDPAAISEVVAALNLLAERLTPVLWARVQAAR